MADRRAQSLPGDGGLVNPFWSARARDEARLQALRPAVLSAAENGDEAAVQQPVPGADEDVRMELEGGRPIGDGSERSGLTRGRAPSRARRSERFTTPASWTQSGGTQSSGPMPEIPATEGPFQGLVQDRVVMELQRMLEQEVVAKLHEENIALKQQMAQLLREWEKGKGQGSQPESST